MADFSLADTVNPNTRSLTRELMRTSKLFLAGGLLALASCATYQPVPEGYAGPAATVIDTGKSEDGTKARMFAMVAVDGNAIANAFGESARASSGRGATLITMYPERRIPIRTMKVTLRGSHATGMPIHEMASRMSGTFFAVEGTTDFTPRAGTIYVVKGELGKERSSVWIEDRDSGEVVTQKISK
jgi:hypothetical protein